MIEDPELRAFLEQEALAVHKEYNSLAETDTESFRRKHKLKNRYEEIERLLGKRKPEPAYVEVVSKHLWQSVVAFASIAVILLSAVVLLHGRIRSLEAQLVRHEDQLARHEQSLVDHSQRLIAHQGLLDAYRQRVESEESGATQ